MVLFGLIMLSADGVAGIIKVIRRTVLCVLFRPWFYSYLAIYLHMFVLFDRPPVGDVSHRLVPPCLQSSSPNQSNCIVCGCLVKQVKQDLKSKLMEFSSTIVISGTYCAGYMASILCISV